jgi:anti-anti-sigma factor
MQLEIDMVTRAEAVVIRLGGELDGSVAERVRQYVEPYLMVPGRTMIADLTDLSFADSTGLSVLVQCHNAARAAGSRFWVEGASGEVAMVLELTCLMDLLSKPVG